MKKDLILAIDIGTSGTKTSIIGADGTVLASATSPHRTWFGDSGRAEQEPGDWWEGTCRNTAMLMGNYPEYGGSIAVIGVSGHMTGCIPVDASGKALYRALIHSDIRAAQQFSYVRDCIGLDQIYHSTGNILDPRSSLCKILWIKQKEPEIYKRTERFLQSKDYIVSCLTGNIDVTDLSDASHAQLIDIRKRTYDETVLRDLDLDAMKLPEIRRGTDIAGYLTGESAAALGLPAGIPVAAGGGDGACANVGAGVVSPGDTYCCLGTTAWIAHSSAEPVIDGQRRLFNIISIDGESCGVYGTVQAAGRSMQWVSELFNQQDVKEFDRLAAAIEPGSEGLVFLPYLEGERSPVYDSDARGVFFGLSPMHTRSHMMRSVLEGVALALRNVLDVYRESAEITSMRIIGGGAASDLWRDIISNTCKVTLETLSVPAADATSLGAAIAAGVGAGLYADIGEGVKSINIRSRQTPQENRMILYNRIYAIYKKLYPVLKPSFAELAQLRGE